MTSLTLCTYNVHSFYDAEGRCRVEDISKLIQELQLDVICLQECDGMHLKKLLKLLEQGPKAFSMVKWGGCAILSSLPMEQVDIEGRQSRTSQGRAEGLPGRRTYHPRFVTARIQVAEDKVLAVTCLHLDHKLEPRRVKEVATIQENLAGLFKRGEAQVWTGDFNALTREDYTEGGWARVTEVRARGAWERPQTEVTSAVRAMGFEDCWATMGRPGPVSTCRFDTHIDYVYLSNPAQETWQCKEVLHHPSNASDHKPVIVKLELKENQES